MGKPTADDYDELLVQMNYLASAVNVLAAQVAELASMVTETGARLEMLESKDRRSN